MEIVGTKCRECGQNIVLASEGKSCAQCGIAVHLICESQDACAVCGQPYQVFERPKADLLSEALLPPALRPGRSGGPALAISAGVLFLLLAIVIWFTIQYVLSNGH
jgi:hypothetical protein